LSYNIWLVSTIIYIVNHEQPGISKDINRVRTYLKMGME